METFQKVYRTKLPTDELQMWCETLKEYSAQEFESAMGELVAHPPRYQLEDGSIQVWRGMPKLPDVVQVMLENREKRYQEWRREESKRLVEEQRRLEQRRAEHPEEFVTLADVFKMAEEQGIKPSAATKRMPEVEREIDWDSNREKLEAQKRLLSQPKGN